MEEQRRAAAAARQELKEEKKPKQTAAGPAPSMALRTAASLQRALSNSDDGDMFWDYGQAAGLRAGMFCASCHAALRCIWPPASQPAICILGRTVHIWCGSTTISQAGNGPGSLGHALHQNHLCLARMGPLTFT